MGMRWLKPRGAPLASLARRRAELLSSLDRAVEVTWRVRRRAFHGDVCIRGAFFSRCAGCSNFGRLMLNVFVALL